jgi:hypothetical protein
MMTYRCYLLGEDGKIRCAEVIECATDAAALEEAERRFSASGYPAIEVWDKARRIGTVDYLKMNQSIGAAGGLQGRMN